ncbi:helix-turn-helix domain-containing protein [Streptomyces sp. NPDC058293]|uniref:helix-turn-helix domain-containing protein n=1 Tax=Streptomyces sp. NPDC058293 TaxID=3346429 RepID=UPI0036EA3AD3
MRDDHLPDSNGEGDEGADKGKRITGTARDELARVFKREYDAGASIRTLADAHGRSYGFVHRILTEAGTGLRGRGGDRRQQT